MKAYIIANEKILHTQFTCSLQEICRENNVDLELYNIDKYNNDDLKRLFAQEKNICVQFDRYKDIQFYKNYANILFLQECCLNPKDKIILDASGYDLYSNFVGGKHNQTEFSECENNNTKNYLENLGFQFDTVNDENQNIAIYLDCVQSEMPFLDVCSKYLPKENKITILAHTNNQSKIYEYRDIYKQKFNNLDLHLFENIKSQDLSQFGAIILRNNDVAYKSMAMGLKVVTFDFGLYTNTQAVLNCRHDIKKLRNCLMFVPDKGKIINLLSAILQYGMSKNITSHHLFYNAQLINWLSRMFF